MQSAIIATGNELLSGDTVDTNSAWLCRQLLTFNISVTTIVTIGDNKQQIVQTLNQLKNQVEIIILTGGLGPTDDDLTRFALAEFADAELIENPEATMQIENYFCQKNREMNQRNRIQAMIPEGAEALENTTGTAPGIKLKKEKTTIFALPGVPREMKHLFEVHLMPRLKQLDTKIIHRKKLLCIGIGESNLAHQIAPITKNFPDVTIGTTVHEGVISIQLTCVDRQKIDELSQILKNELGTIIFGENEQTLPQVIGNLLKEKDQTLAAAESCTGGLIGKMLTDASGASNYYKGGIITYSDELKQSLLNVPEELLQQHGAVSKEVAGAMVEGVLQKTVADWAIAVTGIAGPAGGTKEKPVGLVYIAVADKTGLCKTEKFLFGNPGRETIRIRTATSALKILRELLLSNNP